MSQKRNELVLDYFDGGLHGALFARGLTGLELIGTSSVPLRARATKPICVDACNRIAQELNAVSLGSQLGVVLSVHADVRQARYTHHEVRLQQEMIVTAQEIQRSIESFGLRRDSSTSFSLLEVNGYPTKAPLSKIGSLIGCTVSDYRDTPVVEDLQSAIKTVFAQDPHSIFFLDRCISMLPRSFTPYTLFVIGKHMSEYSVVREGSARESICFEWGFELLPDGASSLSATASAISQDVAEQFWGAISKTTSQLPMPSEYITVTYAPGTAAPLIESIMSGVYTGTGAPMRPKKGSVAEVSATLSNSVEVRARILLESLTQFSFV